MDKRQSGLHDEPFAERLGTLAGTNAWHKILTGAADGVTNVHVVLSSAKANARQVYVVFDGSKNITAVYM